MITLKQAVQTIHRDPAWWRKTLIGGAWYLSGLGIPIAEGYQLESIENTNQGYPTPLPLWRDLGTKALQGVFGVVIDFAYFVFPLLVVGLIAFCGAIGVLVADLSSALIRSLVLAAVVLGSLWWLAMWLSSVSPLAKRMLVSEGHPGAGLSAQVVRSAWEPLARPLWLRARLWSLPPYLLALLLLALAWWAAARTGWLGTLPLLWLALATLFYARLVTIQLYAAAARELQQRRYAAFRARLQTE